MKAVMVMYDSLCRHMLQPYGCDFTKTPNFARLAAHSVTFDTSYAGSLPCMPARRELHTGRLNFLHASWGPLEPFDDSMPEILKRGGVYTHIVSDHTHYFEDGGCGYVTRYNTWEGFRGQEGDRWQGVVGPFEPPENLKRFTGYRGMLYRQDALNRAAMQNECDHPQSRTFDAGIRFIQRNAAQDNWFLQIEAFDPHEPFFSYERWKALYPHDYAGPQFDWPDYAPVTESPEEIAHARYEYAALLSMCDYNLGRVLDEFDRLNLWEDTLLIVCTDHGYMLGEHNFWAKNYMPPYDEVVRTPLFIWDPRSKKAGERRRALVQTIDLPATLLGYFGMPLPRDMQGFDLADTIRDDTPVRQAALFGWFGQHVCITDGRYVYMRAPVGTGAEINEYRLLPIHMAFPFFPEELKNAALRPPFTFTKGCPVLQIPSGAATRYNEKLTGGTMLFDTQSDPGQHAPITDAATEARLCEQMRRLMLENDAPPEQFTRIGL